MTTKHTINIRQVNGSWIATPQPPLAATTDLVTRGWEEIAELREAHDAIDHFPITEDYHAFVKEFGPSPWAQAQQRDEQGHDEA